MKPLQAVAILALVVVVSIVEPLQAGVVTFLLSCVVVVVVLLLLLLLMPLLLLPLRNGLLS